MKTLLTFLVAAALNFGYNNPVIPGFAPDPSVCRVGDDFYLVCSSFQYFPGVPVFHSKDLIHWERIGNVLDRESQLSLKGANAWSGIYAPTIRHHDGKFYMITTNVSSKGNFFVTADSPYGPWSDPVWLSQGGIDPSLFWDDGKCYFCSNPEDGIKICQIDDKTGEQLSPTVEIWKGEGGRYPEAPHIYKKDGWYYLMIAEGGTEYGHSETIARSRNIWGPYEGNPDNPILTNQRQRSQGCEIQGTGHADIVQAPDGSWWMVCLAFRTQNGNHHLLGRETCLLPVEWPDGGWPIVNTDGRVEPVMNVPTLEQKLPDGTPVVATVKSLPRPRFNTAVFGPEWIWLNNPYMENYSLVNGTLRMTSSAVTLDEEGISPSFVALRQESKTASPEVKVDMNDAHSGDVAGLSIYMGHFAHCDIYVEKTEEEEIVETKEEKEEVEKTEKSGLKVTVTYHGLSGLCHTVASVNVPEGATSIKVTSSEFGYSFSCTDCRGVVSDLGFLDCRYLSTETVNGFTGITLGLFATNSKSNKPFTAIFSDYIL